MRIVAHFDMDASVGYTDLLKNRRFLIFSCPGERPLSLDPLSGVHIEVNFLI